MCVDGNGESEIIAFWIVSDETKETLHEMLTVFKNILLMKVGNLLIA